MMKLSLYSAAMTCFVAGGTGFAVAGFCLCLAAATWQVVDLVRDLRAVGSDDDSEEE